MVGTRNATPYGREVTRQLASGLAGSGVTVVSGLARGVDGIAHDATLRAGGRTIAVIGSGLDIVYPPEHRSLFDRIVENGAVLSEYPLGTKPDAQHFPRRNRLLSGLSAATVVIEGGLKSGARPHRPLGARTEQGCALRSRQHLLAGERAYERPHPGRRETRDGGRGRAGGTAYHGCAAPAASPRPHRRHRRRGPAARRAHSRSTAHRRVEPGARAYPSSRPAAHSPSWRSRVPFCRWGG